MGRGGGQAETPRPLAAPVEEFPFDTTRRRMSEVRPCEGGFFVAVRGAPESVLARCDRVHDGTGVRTLDGEARTRLADSADRLAASGLRVLAFAEKLAPERPTDADDAEDRLTFLGVAGFEDPPRPDVSRAIDACRRAGIGVLMVTGDHPSRAAYRRCEHRYAAA